MTTAVTSWKGTPKAIELFIEGSRVSSEIHKEMGAKNPRLLRATTAMICKLRIAIWILTHMRNTDRLLIQ